MAYASQSGRARTSAKNPSAFAVCMRCGIWYNRKDLVFQTAWRGTTIKNIWILVCTRTCLDNLQEQLRSITLPADPVPVYFPSVEQFEADETDYRSLAEVTTDPVTGIPMPSQVLRVTEECENRTTTPYGNPLGLDQNAVMPFNAAELKHYGVTISTLSVVASGTTTIAVTCGRPHGMQTDDQIAAGGLSAANGFYSVTVVTPMAFTYQTADVVKSGGLLTGQSRIITAFVGLPLGQSQLTPTNR